MDLTIASGKETKAGQHRRLRAGCSARCSITKGPFPCAPFYPPLAFSFAPELLAPAMAEPGFEDQLISLLPRLRRFAHALTGSATDADDVVQIGCIKALRGRDGFTPGTRLDSWLFRILQNAWRDELRRRGARPEGASVELDLEIADETDRLGDRTTLAAVRRAMQRLPDDQREALALVSVEGLTYAEAAAALDVPLGTLMSRVARGRQRLRRLVDGEPAVAQGT